MNKFISEVTNEDCMVGMARYPDKYFDLAIVDPPYGIGTALVNGGTWATKYKKKGSQWDVKVDLNYFNELYRVSKNYIVWGANYYSNFIPAARCFIPWIKPNMSGMHTMSDCELALTSFDKNSKSIILTSQSNEIRIHVTQKPVALYKWLLHNYAKQGDKILDTHLGSGSSRIAAYEMGFNFTAFELDTEYFEAQEKRYMAHIAQLKLELI